MASKRRLSVANLGKLFSKDKSKDEKPFVSEKEDKLKLTDNSEKNDVNNNEVHIYLLDDEKKDHETEQNKDETVPSPIKSSRRNSAPDLVKVLKPYPRTLSQGTVGKMNLNLPAQAKNNTISEKRNKYSTFARTSIRNLNIFKAPSKEQDSPNPSMKGIEFNATRSGEILGGTLSKILKWLFSSSSEQEFDAHIQPLLFGYRGFCSKDHLFNLCMKIHEKTAQTPQINKLIKLRIVRMLKIWLKEWSALDFTEMNLLDKTVSFVLQNQALILQEDAIEIYLLTGILRRNHAKMISLKPVPVHSDSESNSTGMNHNHLTEQVNSRRLLESKDYISKCWKNSQSLLCYTSNEISKELTTRQLSLFEKVELKEFVDKNWTRENNDLAPNLLRVIERSNKVTFWVATMVLTAPSTQAQTSVVKHFIQIAKRLAALNNFESLTQIVNGLSHSSVSRLKSVFRTLPSTLNQSLTKLKELTSPNMGYRVYRRRIAKLDTPYFPILAVVLHDYIMIDEVTPNYRKTGAGYVNLEKLRTLYGDSQSLLSNVKLYSEFINTSWMTIPSLIENNRLNVDNNRTTQNKNHSPQRGSLTFRLPAVGVALSGNHHSADQERAPSPNYRQQARRGISPSHFGPGSNFIGRTLVTSRLSRSPSERVNDLFREKEEINEDGTNMSNLSSSSILPLVEILESLIALSEKDLYDRSLIVEPRSGSRGTVLFPAPPVTKDESESDSPGSGLGPGNHPLLETLSQNASSPNLLTNLSNLSNLSSSSIISVEEACSINDDSVSNSPSFPMLC